MPDLSNIPTDKLGMYLVLGLCLLFGLAGGIQFYIHEHAGQIYYAGWGYEIVAGLLFFLFLELRAKNY